MKTKIHDNIYNTKQFLREFEKRDENLKDLYRLLIRTSEILVKVAYFLSFQLDVSQQIKLNLPLFNFLKGLKSIFREIGNMENFVLAVTILQHEEGLKKENFFHFGDVISLIQQGIGQDDYSPGNNKWINFIYDLNVRNLYSTL